MVLFGTTNLYTAPGVQEGFQTGPRIEVLHPKIIFKLCLACQSNVMAAIPPSAFSAGRIRRTQQESRELKISKTSKGNESPKYFNTSFMELSPLKYNSKLMNSIWGLYNRYSPHNVKKINDANSFSVAGETQQSPANNKNDSMITIPSAKLDNVWAAMNVSQSH